MFTYLDAVIVDLPIFDSNTRSSTKDTFAIRERLDRASGVLEYLKSVWNQFEKECDFFNWEEISDALGKDIEEVRRRTGG